MLVTERIRQAEAYLAILGEPPWSTWHEGYERFCEGSLSTVEALALAEPDGWPLDTSPAFRHDYLGARFQADSIIAPGMKCDAESLYGSPCPLNLPLVCDHLFPQARGGATTSGNLLILCDVHNRSKSDDVHLYPWEKHNPADWLADTLAAVAAASA